MMKKRGNVCDRKMLTTGEPGYDGLNGTRKIGRTVVRHIQVYLYCEDFDNREVSLHFPRFHCKLM